MVYITYIQKDLREEKKKKKGPAFLYRTTDFWLIKYQVPILVASYYDKT